MTINKSDVTEVGVHRFATCASDLGLKAGEWPVQIATSLGNGQPLIRGRSNVVDGDLLDITYNQSCGCIAVRIFND